jgi:predicted Rossmann fold nucleotide-binding protein DprA/Smf involved in DNA uptake
MLSANPVDADSLIAASGLRTGDVLTTLMNLELKGRIQQLPGKTFIRKE